MQQLTDKDFDMFLRSSFRIVLVYFTSVWCVPCAKLKKPLMELQDEFHDDLEVVSVDVEQSPEIAKRFHVEALPQLVWFANGNVVQSLIGAQQPIAIRLATVALIKSLSRQEIPCVETIR